MNNIFVLNKNYKQIGVLSNQGANPQAPYFNDLYVQDLETGADTYEFSTISSKYTQDLLEIGNHIMFAYRGRQELFTITSIEYSHNEGYKTIGVYAEGIGFDLLEIYMKRPANEKENNGGNDSDNDGDDNTDDEYADVDDVYIDENGNIIYDKYGKDDYADQDNVTIDENGNIIYRRSKNNRKNDSLEFKNISYPRFLSIILKNSGWSYICQPGLESVKHNITVRYDRNIFAVLQDSMRDYRGVELEFVHEYNGGSVKKVIKAYKDGGRGSFIGKRFEYGTNVRGITKLQEVANSEDDTVLRIDNVGIDITYDVDFALKSAEIPEIEIGDTHYVIDKDFYPPMTIKARIGKIEVSFSDPTRNKIYLANNKRISGSAIEDELSKDDIKDIIDDYDDDNIAYDHYHDRIISGKRTLVVNDDDYNDGLYYIPNSDKGYEFQVFHAGSGIFLPMTIAPQLGDPDHCFHVLFCNHIYGDSDISTRIGEFASHVVTPVVKVSEKIIFPDDSVLTSANGLGGGTGGSPDNPTNLISAEHIIIEGKDGTAGQLDVYGKLYVTEEIKCELTTETNTLKVNTIEFSDGSTLTTANGSGGGGTPSNPGTGGGTITDGFDIVEGNKLIAELIEAAYIDVSDRLRVKEIFATNIDTKILDVNAIAFPDGTTLTSASDAGASVAYITDVTIDSNNHLIITLSNGKKIDAGALPSGGGTSGGTLSGIPIEYIQQENSSMYLGTSWIDIDNDIHVKGNIVVDGISLVGGGDEGGLYLEGIAGIKFNDGSFMETAGVSGSSGSYSGPTTQSQYAIFKHTNSDTIETSLIQPIGGGNGSGTINIDGSIDVESSIRTHALVVNNPDIIGATGMIILPDGITFPDGSNLTSAYDVSAASELSEYATIEQLQEEVRIKDEQIANLEARLARLEALLDNNNN